MQWTSVILHHKSESYWPLVSLLHQRKALRTVDITDTPLTARRGVRDGPYIAHCVLNHFTPLCDHFMESTTEWCDCRLAISRLVLRQMDFRGPHGAAENLRRKFSLESINVLILTGCR